jgi:uncharacterized protein YbjT (DUF2867 family)
VRLFLAGATGAVGAIVLPLAEREGHAVVPHVRPQSAAKTPLARHPNACVADLGDTAKVADAMRGCGAAVCLVGTMRSRFAQGDSYATSDVGAVRDLVAAAKAAGVPRVVLLSSLGAGGMGAYLRAKGEAERLVTGSGLAFAIARPGAFASPEGAPEGLHGGRAFPGFGKALFAGLGAVGLRDFSHRYGPMPLDVLAKALLRAADGRADGCILHGDDLQRLAAG